jgi:P63C domain-containing protein
LTSTGQTYHRTKASAPEPSRANALPVYFLDFKSIFGRLNPVADLVYERLAPELLDGFEKMNSVTENGHRKARHHQWLTNDIGVPALAHHIHAETAATRACDTCSNFYGLHTLALPKKRGQLELLIEA